jgi:hypothetical protein
MPPIDDWRKLCPSKDTEKEDHQADIFRSDEDVYRSLLFKVGQNTDGYREWFWEDMRTDYRPGSVCPLRCGEQPGMVPKRTSVLSIISDKKGGVEASTSRTLAQRERDRALALYARQKGAAIGR